MSVRTQRDGAVLVVTIDRPQVRNAVDRPTADALEAAFRRFEADPELVVAVLTGAGGHFCAGADLRALATGGATNRVEPGEHAPMGPTRLELSKPVIAAVEGYAVGGGFELALWCDLRVAAEDATFGVFNRRFGVPLIDGGTVRLPRLLGLSRALDLILTGRPLPATEAAAIGLVHRLVPSGRALEAAVELAGALAAVPQAGLRADRASALHAFDAPLAAALEAEHERGAPAVTDPELHTAVRRWLAGGAASSGTVS